LAVTGVEANISKFKRTDDIMWAYKVFWRRSAPKRDSMWPKTNRWNEAMLEKPY
jgi:hypothetical protein